MTEDQSGDVEQLNGLRRRGRGLRRFLALRWRWLAARSSSWRAGSLPYIWGRLSSTTGVVQRGLRTCKAGLRPVADDCLASQRVAKLVTLLKKLAALARKIESRYPWRRWLRQTGQCCQRGWLLALAQGRTGIGWLKNWTASNRFLANLIKQSASLAVQIGRSQRIRWLLGACRRWCRRLAPYSQALSSAWPSTREIIGEFTGETTGETTGAAPAGKTLQGPGVWVDSESPLGYARQIWSTRARDAYLFAGASSSMGNLLWADGDCPMGYARIPADYFPPPEPEIPEFQPDDFLLDLFRAYSQLLEQRGDSSPKLAPVVPLIDVFALLSLVNPDYSPDCAQVYTREDFIKDVYRLHSSGVDTTLGGARISFPISRGVKGKTLTVTDDSGTERRYYGVRFLEQVGSG